jgi:antitoxin component YwqK of YwqJK toxin-antitoxin module
MNMIKYIFPIAILVLSISSCGSDESESKELEEAKIAAEKDSKPSRKSRRRSRRDSLYSEVSPKESTVKKSANSFSKAKSTSKKDGLNLTYYPSGTMKSEVSYLNGKKRWFR